jgi:hypothetical protein
VEAVRPPLLLEERDEDALLSTPLLCDAEGDEEESREDEELDEED